MAVSKTITSITTEGNSSWFSGHFPNNPILPGIAQLKMVVDIIARQRTDDWCMTGFSRVKFRKIVKPGDQLDIQVTCSDTENHCTFKITSGDEDVCSGKMLFTQNEKLQIHESRY